MPGYHKGHGLTGICDDDEYQLTEVSSIIDLDTASTIRSSEGRERQKKKML